MTRIKKSRIAGLGMLAILSPSQAALASVGCRAFQGGVDDQTRGEDGNRAGAGFNKGDKLTVVIRQVPGQMKQTANLLEYASPDGPPRALTEDTSEGFVYTVPERTESFIYLNLGGVFRGVTVTWACTPAPENVR